MVTNLGFDMLAENEFCESLAGDNVSEKNYTSIVKHHMVPRPFHFFASYCEVWFLYFVPVDLFLLRISQYMEDEGEIKLISSK